MVEEPFRHWRFISKDSPIGQATYSNWEQLPQLSTPNQLHPFTAEYLGFRGEKWIESGPAFLSRSNAPITDQKY